MSGSTAGAKVFDTVETPQNGTIVGTVPTATGKIGEALSFSGSDSNYVDFGNVFDPGPDSYTVSLWFKATTVAPGTQFLAGKWNASSGEGGWSVFLGTSAIQVRGMQENGTRFGQYLPGAVSANEWHNVVMVIDRDTNTVRGYLDGSNAGFLAGGSGATGDTLTSTGNRGITTNIPLWLGRRSTTGAPFSGLIDDFAIWDRALSADEIEYLYMKGLQGFDAATIPEPSSMVLCGIGLALLAARAARRRKPK